MNFGSIIWVMWNALLAIIPVGAAYALRGILNKKPSHFAAYAATAVLGVIWFIFLPNTCYLLTEWRHFLEALDSQNLFLRANTDNLLFIKLVVGSIFYFLYSLFGMFTFAMAIRPVERAAIKRGISIKFWAIPFFAAIALGVYLGLVLRFNSWDLLKCPSRVWLAIVEVFGRPKLTLFILAFGGFLWIAYEVLDIWIDGLKQRLTMGKSDA